MKIDCDNVWTVIIMIYEIKVSDLWLTVIKMIIW